MGRLFANVNRSSGILFTATPLQSALAAGGSDDSSMSGEAGVDADMKDESNAEDYVETDSDIYDVSRCAGSCRDLRSGAKTADSAPLRILALAIV